MLGGTGSECHCAGDENLHDISMEIDMRESNCGHLEVPREL